jgi:hypothetical protein
MVDPNAESTNDPGIPPQAQTEVVSPQKSTTANSVDVRNPRKFADHPHWWTILLSAIAIVISVLSYLESHRNRALNEEVFRPIIRVASIVDRGQVFEVKGANPARRENAVDLHILNNGKTFAGNVVVTYKAQLDDMRVGTDYLKFSDDKDATEGKELIGDLAPDEVYTLVLWVSELKYSPTIDLGDGKVNTVSLYIKGNVNYTSPTDGSQHNDKFCFYEGGMYGQFVRCPLPDPTK